MSWQAAARQAPIDAVLADPPVVHYLTYDDLISQTLTGVHSTDPACYRFLAEICGDGSRTLETGSGISTVLFAAWGTEHLCFTLRQEEADAIIEYCRVRGIPTDGLTFEIGPSATTLPPARGEGLLDVVVLDGNHGFPHPMIDWFYSAGRLRRGGVLVLDDVHLPAVKLLCDFLQSDGRWERLRRTSKWIAYERRDEGPLDEDWFHQTFYRMPGWRRRPIGRVERRIRAHLHPLRQAVRRYRKAT